MINEVKEYTIKCDNCNDFLVHAENSPLTSYRGHNISEDTIDNIKTVAKWHGWLINENKHICLNCKQSKT